jgi:lipopolysaccharide/colanic/teichoic acid biosynthesis glycosyltransferase
VSFQANMKLQALRHAILAGDLLWIIGALGIALVLRYLGASETIVFAQHFQKYLFVVLAAAVMWTFLYLEMSLDGFKGGWNFPAIFSKLVVAVCLLMVVVSAFAFLTNNLYSRLVLFYFALFFLLGLAGMRCLAGFLLTSHVGSPVHRCVVVGNGPVAQELARKFASHPELPFQVVGFLFPAGSEAPNGLASPAEPTASSVQTLQALDLLAQLKVQKLIIAAPYPNRAELRSLIAECRKSSMEVYLVPQLYDLYLSRAELIEIDGLPLISLRENSPPALGFAIKRALDIMLAVGILLLVSPILAVAASVVYGKKGKAFRAEIRCGKDGAPFRMFRLNIDRHSARPHGYERLFVRWSLTELPQLWNVLRGDMSLVGPRPESPERVKYYSDWQRQRLKVHAGVTGLAQVHGLREQHSSEDKTRFDLQYIFHWSPFLDLSLMLQTVWTLLSRGLNQDPAPSEQPAGVRSAAGDLLRTEIPDANRS